MAKPLPFPPPRPWSAAEIASITTPAERPTPLARWVSRLLAVALVACLLSTGAVAYCLL